MHRLNLVRRRHGTPQLMAIGAIEAQRHQFFLRRSRVRKSLFPTMHGEECPNGTSIFHTTFFSGPNSIAGWPGPNSQPARTAKLWPIGACSEGVDGHSSDQGERRGAEGGEHARHAYTKTQLFPSAASIIARRSAGMVQRWR
ncbi:hypothetical protein CfE428DRAFT_6181 [Chthoniobacter flavus Ellin428]|uniref:Uncharacterized protein n=1 Tax=Chthoniobacter flavus Ellin428 TaxID=497964 RepID=B4DB90_9BACT|nr:hypothetical protein CfE428DRAFT_6181 [Chthoniobacter flavus Ellin428]